MKKFKKQENSATTRSRQPNSTAFSQFMSSHWENRVDNQPLDFLPEKQYSAARRKALSRRFAHDRLLIYAGDLKIRANDCDYKFRAHSAFAHLTGLGMDYEPGAVLMFEPVTVRDKSNAKAKLHTHICTLFIEPMKNRTTDEFYTSSRYGEFWIGKKPSLQMFEIATGIRVLPKSELKNALKEKFDVLGKTRIVSEADSDAKLLEACAKLRLVKDNWEISQLEQAVQITKEGFEDVIRQIPQIAGKPRSEKAVEGIFANKAITKGNDVGYGTIAASGENATTLHWTRNTGILRPGELLLLDAGVEMDSLYTADITRTLPISGEFTFWQRKVYDVVLQAANSAFRYAKPGNSFGSVHDEAMRVIAQGLIDLGILKCSLDDALSENGGQHRRWMCHGTSHHLGLDVHDCAAVKRHEYVDGLLEPGMVITIEPGLYFKSDDMLVPREFRGIGVRIEDDIVITENGARNLSADIPRNPEHVESWMKTLWGV
jgi:Xaa-Pro aminopeptidase